MRTSSEIARHRPTTDTLSDRVKAIITTYLDLPVELVVREAKLSLDLGLDSLEIIELAIAFEAEFDIRLDDRSVAGFETVDDIVSHLRGLVNSRS